MGFALLLRAFNYGTNACFNDWDRLVRDERIRMELRFNCVHELLGSFEHLITLQTNTHTHTQKGIGAVMLVGTTMNHFPSNRNVINLNISSKLIN